MGIDITTSRTEKTDRCKYYKKEYVQNMKLVQDAVVQGVFYSHDVEPFTTRRISSGSIQKSQTIGTIETTDHVGDLEPNFYVLYEGEIYVVEEVSRQDKATEKEFSRNPSKVTKIRLRR